VRFSAGSLFSAARCSSARANCVEADSRRTAEVVEASGFGPAHAPPTHKSAAKTGEKRAKLLRKFFWPHNIYKHSPKRLFMVPGTLNSIQKYNKNFREPQQAPKTYRRSNFAVLIRS